MRLEIKRKLSARSDRVKSVDIHPTEPWILASLFNGNVFVWNYKTQSLVKSFEVTELPVRTAKFVPRKQWIVVGADDMFIRVYNYNTMEKLKAFEGHSDYIRCIAVHPTQPFLLSSSDDMLIKLWDWDKNWLNTMTFEGHNHYVMQVVFNPKDSNTFASASLDRTIKVWGLNSPTPHFTLEGHEKGVNCVEYFSGGDKPYLISGSDDKEIKVWDYQNKTCVQTLEGHSHNVTVVCFHPTLPIIISGSEDNTIRIWHSQTYRLEKTLNYGWERVWALAYLKGSNKVAMGYDEGSIMIQLGSEEPAVSMDQSGKIIWAKNNEIQTLNVKGVTAPDGERLPLAVKDLGNCEVFPQTLKHNSNGRFIVVCGDAEYTIYTALAWRNKTYGNGLDFVWASGTGEYAVRESSSKISVFKNFKAHKPIRPNYSAEGTFGGPLLGVRSNTFVCFYDWEECEIIRKIDVCPKAVYWSENGELVAIACESTFYILRYNKDAVAAAESREEDGIENAFEVLHELTEKVRTAIWVGDCFIYTNATSRLNYCVGGKIVTISHLDRQMYLLGYLPKESKIYLVDKSHNVISYTLHVAVVNYQTAVIRGDMETAAKLLPKIPQDQRNRIAQFLEGQGKKEEALEVSVDPDHRFDLAIQLNNLNIAHAIAKEQDAEHKWKQLGDLALQAGKFGLAEDCLNSAEDLEGLLLLYVSSGHHEGVERLATLASNQGKNNIAFICYFLLRKLDKCIDLLCNTGRIPEAAFFARTYLPSQISRIVALWREDLQTLSARAAESLADPTEYENLFPDLKYALKAEKYYAKLNKNIPASSYPALKDDVFRDLIEEIKLMEENGETIELDEEPQPTEPIRSPAPTPAAIPQPASSPAPSPVPSPATEQQKAPSPVPSPEPSPVPSPVQQKAPSPVPSPVPSPEPSPVPSPKQERAPSPVPSPKQEKAPSPVPAPAPAPAPAPKATQPKEEELGLDDDDALDDEVNNMLDEGDLGEDLGDEDLGDEDFEDF